MAKKRTLLETTARVARRGRRPRPSSGTLADPVGQPQRPRKDSSTTGRTARRSGPPNARRLTGGAAPSQSAKRVTSSNTRPPCAPTKQPTTTHGLHWTHDGDPGYWRVGSYRRGQKPRLSYVDDGGRQLRDKATLERIRKLVIPPAWTDVWICRDPRGHLQATGRDARGRKQYRYHPAFRSVREEQKFGSLLNFAEVLPCLRARVTKDLCQTHQDTLPKEKVLAAVVRLLDETHVRIGNEAYARENRSFGLTTLRRHHVELDGPTIRLHFRGKAGKKFDVRLTDRQVAKVLRGCAEIPGQQLFHCGDEQTHHPVCSHDVNAYLHEIASREVTAKTFRTWWGTVLAMQCLRARPAAPTLTARKKQVREAIVAVSKALGNTPAVCRKSYIHPGVLEHHLEARLHCIKPPKTRSTDLSPDEQLVVAFLKKVGSAETSVTARAA